MADVVLPAAAVAGASPRARSRAASAACSACARRWTRRARRATTSRSSVDARRAGSGHDWGAADAEQVWDELRSLSPWHAGMSYARLEALGRHAVAVPRREPPGQPVPPRPAVGATRSRAARRRSCRSSIDPPVDELDDEFPLRLTTGRRLDSFNTGVQTGGYTLAAAARRDARHRRPRTRARLGVPRASSCGSSRAAARSWRRCAIDAALRPGLAFMTLHFPDEVATNLLTIDATDPKSGTAEFKATAIRVEKPVAAPPALARPAARLEAPSIGSPRSRGPLSVTAPSERGPLDQPTIVRPVDLHHPGRGRRPPRSARPSTRCSDRRRPAGRAAAARRARRARRCGGRRGARPAPSAAAGAARGAGARRLDQPRRAQLHLPAADGAARRGLRRRHVLRAVLDRAAAADVVHVCDDIACRAERRRGALRRARARLGPAGRPTADGDATWMRSPCLGLCERAPAALCRQRAGDAGAATSRRWLAGRARRRASSALPAGAAELRRPPATRIASLAPQTPDRDATGLRLLRRVGRSIPRASTTTARTAATRRCAARFELGPERRDPRGRRRRSWSAAAAPRFRPAASGRRWRARRRARTTWSATPTSPSRARSRTAC